jgi:hypothetical protein
MRAIIVDGHFKTQFLDESAANDAAKKLLSSFPRLRIEVHSADAGKKRSHADSNLRPPPFEGNAIGESAFPAIPFIPAGYVNLEGNEEGLR